MAAMISQILDDHVWSKKSYGKKQKTCVCCLFNTSALSRVFTVKPLCIDLCFKDIRIHFYKHRFQLTSFLRSTTDFMGQKANVLYIRTGVGFGFRYLATPVSFTG